MTLEELIAHCEKPIHHIRLGGPALSDPLVPFGVVIASDVLPVLRHALGDRKLIDELLKKLSGDYVLSYEARVRESWRAIVDHLRARGAEDGYSLYRPQRKKPAPSDSRTNNNE